jgi:hypothetical protein
MTKTALAEHHFTLSPLRGTQGEAEYLNLPSPDTQRWDTKRKAQVVNAVCAGHLSLDRACEIYAMSVDEFLSWQSLLERYGAKGLMATRIKEYRAKRVVG